MIPESAEVRSDQPAPPVDLSLHPPDCDCEDCTADFHARKPAAPSLRETLPWRHAKACEAERSGQEWVCTCGLYAARRAALASSDPGSPLACGHCGYAGTDETGYPIFSDPGSPSESEE